MNKVPHFSLSGCIARVDRMAYGYNIMDKLEHGKRLSKDEIKYVGKRFVNRMRKYYRNLKVAG